MVHFTFQFNNVTATPNLIRVKYPDVNISQATHSSLLKLPFLPVEALRVHLFYTLAPGSLLFLGKLCDVVCTAYFNAKKFYIFLQDKIVLQGVRSASTTFLWKLNKYHNYYQEHGELQLLNAVIDNPSISEHIKFYHVYLFLITLQKLVKDIDAGDLTTFSSIT